MSSSSAAESFASFGLDARLTRAVLKAKLTKPTLVQATAIPIALEGKDVLCRARTGSGKTAAYSLPLLQKILLAKEATPELKAVLALVLVPTRELCEQVGDHLKQMTFYCSRLVKYVCLTADAPLNVQKQALAHLPDVIVSTPGRIVAHLDAGNVTIKDSLQTLVIDEADLVLSFGFQDDMRRIVSHLPNIVQTLMMSATLNADVEQLKQMVLKKAAILRLEEGSEDHALKQYFVMTTDTDKFLLLFFILKLKLVKGKTIIFVNTVERCYKVKLFLEQFGIKACVLNAELPQNSRYHIVQEFNRGVYDYIIATDETHQLNPRTNSNPEANARPADDGETESGGPPPTKKANNKAVGGSKRDAEFGVARGVDFKDVAAVINLDFATSLPNYTHRVGRTARGGKAGTALSFVLDKDEPLLQQIQLYYTESEAANTPGKEVIKPFKFKMDDVNAFRYRVDDALRAVTRSAIREARLKEIRAEILNSEKLKAHFEDNPNDLAALRHDKTLLQNRVSQELKHVPSYLLPKDKVPKTVEMVDTEGASTSVSGTESGGGMMLLGAKKKRQWVHPPNSAQKKRRKENPLKSFKFKSGVSMGGRKKARIEGCSLFVNVSMY